MASDHERALGMDRRISRRDYLNSVLLASGGALLDAAAPLNLARQEGWDGYSGVGDYQGSNGNTWQVMSEAHKIRDHAYGAGPKAADTGEVYDCVVVGGESAEWLRLSSSHARQERFAIARCSRIMPFLAARPGAMNS
jgi:hypothetical protein